MSKELPLVSVLMTAYNREKYIADAIESVLASSYRKFELIITDDQSKDKTLEIARSYEKLDARVQVFKNEKNLGDYPNRNRAASYAKGKYLKYVDADDLIYPWGLKVMVDIMESYPDVGWGLCSLDQNVKRLFPIKLTPKEAYEYNYLGPGLFHKAPLSSIIKRELFEREGGFISDRLIGDFEMWHRLAMQHAVVLMPQGMVWYREHDDQESSRYLTALPLYERIKVKYLKHSECPLESTIRATLLKKQRLDLQKALLKNTFRMKFNTAIINYKQLKEHRCLRR